MVVAIAVVVEAGIDIKELAMEKPVPIERTRREIPEGACHVADDTESFVAISLLHHSACIDDSHRVEEVAQDIVSGIQWAAVGVFPADQVPSVCRVVDVFPVSSAGRVPFFNDAPLVVVEVSSRACLNKTGS